MENSKREIESFLYLYPSAIKYYDSIKYNQQKVSNKQLKQLETFYGILIDIVNDWMKVLLHMTGKWCACSAPSVYL